MRFITQQRYCAMCQAQTQHILRGERRECTRCQTVTAPPDGAKTARAEPPSGEQAIVPRGQEGVKNGSRNALADFNVQLPLGRLRQLTDPRSTRRALGLSL